MKASISIFAILFLTAATELPAQQKDPKPPQPWRVPVKLQGFLTEGGLANVIAGDVLYLDETVRPQRLSLKQRFENGDQIQVGPESFVEVLLNPGSYLRLWANTRVRFIDVSPDNLTLELIDGSIIVENYIAPRGMFEHPNDKQNPNDLRDSFD